MLARKPANFPSSAVGLLSPNLGASSRSDISFFSCKYAANSFMSVVGLQVKFRSASESLVEEDNAWLAL